MDTPKVSGRFAKGNPGKPKGAVTKVGKEIKDMILTALELAGGESYLLERAQDPKTQAAFLGLVGKAMPLQVKGTGPNGEHVFERIVREVVDPKA